MQLPDIALAKQTCERLIRSDRFNVKALCDTGATLRNLGCAAESRKCYKTAVAAVFHAIKIGHVEAALSFEILIHDAFVSAIEDDAHYYRCYSDWREEMARFGRRFRSRERPMSANASGVGFIMPTGSLLGHTEVLFNILKERRAIEKLGVKPRIYVLRECQQKFISRAAQAGAEVVVADNELADGAGASTLQRIEWLRERLYRDDCAVAVWVTAAPEATFTLSAGLAPVQIFWSLRFHPITGPYIDGYITYGPTHEAQKIFGKTAWQICPVPLTVDIAQRSREEIDALRKRFPQDLLLGTLAREQKIDSRPFLESVVAILKQNLQAGFLWTGRNRHPGIQQFFENAGVADRCHFVGWVDSVLYAQALDVFLETFPLGCGITGYQALGSGTALLSYFAENTVFGMQFGIGPSARDEDQGLAAKQPILCARNPGEYVALANRLIADRGFRETTAILGREFFEREIASGEYYTTRFFECVTAIAEATLAAKMRPAETPS